MQLVIQGSQEIHCCCCLLCLSHCCVPTALHSRSLFGSKGTFTSFFSRGGYTPPHSPGGEASIHGGGAGGFKQVEAKYPALLFKQQLDAFVQKIFPMLRDNVKKEITPQLAACIHAPKSSHRGAGRGKPGEAPGGCFVLFWCIFVSTHTFIHLVLTTCALDNLCN